MNITLYSVRDDERPCLDAYKDNKDITLIITGDEPSLANLDLVDQSDGVCVLGQTMIGKELLDAWHAKGVKYVSTRTIGYNHIDVGYAHSLGLRVCHASYAPDGVADFTIMMILMCLRNYKQALWRGQVNDYALFGLEGREMRSLTIGVMGTGHIGQRVLKSLTGFGCQLVAYDIHEDEETKKIAEYLPLDEFYRQCDVISLHMPLLESTRHMINAESLGKMKDGVVIINCARGGLADLDALIDGIESGKIGALGLDVVEGEEGITHVDHRIDIISNKNMAYIRQFPNVIMTQHMAFYTKEAVRSMVQSGIMGIMDMAENDRGQTEIGALAF